MRLCATVLAFHQRPKAISGIEGKRNNAHPCAAASAMNNASHGEWRRTLKEFATAADSSSAPITPRRPSMSLVCPSKDESSICLDRVFSRPQLASSCPEPGPNPTWDGSSVDWPVPLLGGVRGGLIGDRFMETASIRSNFVLIFEDWEVER